MDRSSSGEELVVKARKPYTITKQRERWTDEEHSRFLEAVKLYGRAWQRIEEHVGTKTAVQIRSHAQKFISKLEKEALTKGDPVGQALDIDIPPPRPKRKPINPYPRKSSVVVPTPQVGEKEGKSLISASSHCKQGLDLEKEYFLESSEVSKVFKQQQCFSAHSANENFARAHVGLKGPCKTKEFKSSRKETNQDNSKNEVPSLPISKPSEDKPDRDRKGDDSTGALATDEILGSSKNRRHAPVHVIDRSVDTCPRSPPADVSFQHPFLQPVGDGHGFPNPLANPAACTNTGNLNNAPRTIHHSFSILSSLIAVAAHHNQDDYRTFLHMSSAFSSLIASTLLPNPAAHASASFAASFWPHANLDYTSGSPGYTLPLQMESPPSMASIAAATVAAATAWWAAQGLLPLCAPLQSSSAHSPAIGVPSLNTGRASSSKTERVYNTSHNPTLQDQQMNPEHSEILQSQHLASKSHTVTSTDSEKSGARKQNGREKVAIPEKIVAETELHVSDKTKAVKQVVRSSSGSNSPSSSEVRAGALKGCGKGKDSPKEPGNDHTHGEHCNRCKSIANMSESWKKVSEEGKLAFQELFSREVLPQSFSPTDDQQNEGLEKKTNDDTHKSGKKHIDPKLLDFNSNTGGLFDNQAVGKNTKHDDDNGKSELLTIGLANGKLTSCWTGFKPYKRCSVEVKESRANFSSTQGVEKGPKRTRLEGEAST